MLPARADHPSAPVDRLVQALTYPVWPAWKAFLQDAGVDGANVLRRAKLPGDLFARNSVRLDSETYHRLWHAIEEEAGPVGGPVPLRLAQTMTTDWFNPELFVALCSDDLNGALNRLARYKSGPMTLRLDQTPHGTVAELQFLDRAQTPPRVLMAFKLAFLVQLARIATRSPVHPVRIGWPAPALSVRDAGAYASWFGVAVQDLSAPTVEFALVDTQRPFLTANHGMWKFFEPALRQRLADLEKHASTVERVRAALVESLPAGEVSMAAVCKKLGVSARTLQRRLREEGSSFQQTLDALRHSLANHYLFNSSLSGAEISFLLGFEDPNSFVRAFQMWSGSTPQAARLAHARGTGH